VENPSHGWEMPELNGGFNGIVQQAMFDYRWPSKLLVSFLPLRCAVFFHPILPQSRGPFRIRTNDPSGLLWKNAFPHFWPENTPLRTTATGKSIHSREPLSNRFPFRDGWSVSKNGINTYRLWWLSPHFWWLENPILDCETSNDSNVWWLIPPIS
jgi:hypothetical protein